MIADLTVRTYLGAADLLPFLQRDQEVEGVELREWERRPAAIALAERGWHRERIAHATGLRVAEVDEVLDGTYVPAARTEPDSKATIRLRHMSERELVGGRWIHPKATHGTVSGYKHWGCRCWPCSDAKSLIEAENRRRRAEADLYREAS